MALHGEIHGHAMRCSSFKHQTCVSSASRKSAYTLLLRPCPKEASHCGRHFPTAHAKQTATSPQPRALLRQGLTSLAHTHRRCHQGGLPRTLYSWPDTAMMGRMIERGPADRGSPCSASAPSISCMLRVFPRRRRHVCFESDWLSCGRRRACLIAKPKLHLNGAPSRLA